MPQLEAPDETARAVTAWLRGTGALAVKAATPKRKRRVQPQRLRQVKKTA